MIKGFLYHELEVDVSADDLWEIYGTIRLAKVVVEMIPHVILKVEVEEGDGGVGTIIRTSYPPGSSGPKYSKQKFVKVDNEKHVKEIKVIEGGLIELGFSSYLIHFEIIEKEKSISIIKSSILYELKDDHIDVISLASIVPSVHVANTVVKHIKESKI
ncbi:hypothetical protein M5K25_010187 [Dendrobium thyrsiflorum]|uniref:Bet v I/Major latex protein domain-containing protein n=1 Tax=Dendrobium thyrsiflorum TaxID=117978 RepID=A0ABD0V6W7_DENTH